MKTLLPTAALAALTLLLAGCGLGGDRHPPMPDLTTDPNMIVHGRIIGQDALISPGTAVITALDITTAELGPQQEMPTSMHVAADGTFTLAFPSATAVRPYLTPYVPAPAPLSEECSDQLETTPPTLQTVIVNGLYFAGDKDARTTRSWAQAVTHRTTRNLDGSTTEDARYLLWMYADVPAHLTRTMTCTDTQTQYVGTSRMDLTVHAGWNTLATTKTFTVFPDGRRRQTNTAANVPGPMANTVWEQYWFMAPTPGS
ncbi:hypothetical protein [Deinococcus sonorensis]|uniref:Lipoprotein n=2 Tax=Deinococcus sonorensis TaxID=309891 RepID=A0AAU7UGS9_9DEIO